MLRTHWITNSSAAKSYYQVSDYYSPTTGDWLGKGAKMLGLEGQVRQEDFFSLCDNLDPRTGKPLTTHTRDGRRVGIDLNFNSTKSVGIVRELAGKDNAGDARVEAAHREAVAYVMGLVEDEMQGRVRRGGKQENRVTGNMVAMRVTHRDTRINGDDSMPDMSLHDHVVVFNATYDPVERKWKAAEMGQIKHDAPFYEALYHNRLACNLRQLGYGIRRKAKAFEVAGVSEELISKFSRRRAYIDQVAEKLGIESGAGRDVLGATTRLGKAKVLADDLNGYWASRLTDKESQQLGNLMGMGSYQSSAQDGVRYAIGHMFERASVVDEKRLYEAALRHGIGSVTAEGVMAEAKKQGVLLRDRLATTRDVLAEEGRIIRFAREGRGTMRPLSNRSEKLYMFENHIATLSPEQQALVSHVLQSQDRMMLVIGDAGTGKTRSIKAAFQAIDRPIEMLAPSADASRGVLRDEGFSKSDTVASFLMSDQRQAAVKNGVIWIDEAGLLPIRDLTQLVTVAEQQNARLVLQGDPKQHKSPARHGNMMNVLQNFAGLPVGRLTQIWRQQHKGYRAAVADIARGKLSDGLDRLSRLGWVNQTESNKALVDDFMAALASKRADQKTSDRVIVVAPTHAEADEITGEIRERMKADGVIGKDERTFDTLVPLNWTEAERGDAMRYEGTEVMQFHRNSGDFKAGERVRVTDWKPGQQAGNPKNFAVYGQASLQLAVGDAVRVTANGKDKSGWHKLNNGSQYTVAGFTKAGDIKLSNGWTLDKSFGHLTHGYVTTSHASQGKTVDRVLIAMGSESLPAINAEQFYVSVSRGREKASIYSDLSPEQLREAISKADSRKSATELMGEDKPQSNVMWEFMKRLGRRLLMERETEERSRTNERSTA